MGSGTSTHAQREKQHKPAWGQLCECRGAGGIEEQRLGGRREEDEKGVPICLPDRNFRSTRSTAGTSLAWAATT